jgi:hypothetical protein
MKHAQGKKIREADIHFRHFFAMYILVIQSLEKHNFEDRKGDGRITL